MKDFSLFQNTPYVMNLLEQPQAFGDTIRGLASSKKLISLVSLARRRKFNRVVLTGMGSSFHALHDLQLTLLGLGIDALMIEASEFVHYMQTLCAPTSLIVVVSQSGQSAEILRLLKINRGRAPIIAVTNTVVSPLTDAADAVVLTVAGPEVSVSCKTYISSLAALHWIGTLFSDHSLVNARRTLTNTLLAVTAYMKDWRSHAAQLESVLLDKQTLFLVGRGASLAAVGTGALIIKEANRYPAEGMSSAAFRHGPLELVGPGTFVFVFRGDRRTRQLNMLLLKNIHDAGGRGVIVGAGSLLPACSLEERPRVLNSVLEILPIQMATLALAAHTGREPGQFRQAKKITTTE